MAILRDFERRLEGAVEGFFARAFRSGLQPVELAKAIQRYAGHYKQVDVDGIVIPNVYRLQLSESDADRFQGYGEALRHELAGVVHRTARERNWRLKGPVRIEIRVDDDVRPGTYELRGKIEAKARQASAPRPAPKAPPVAPAVTQTLEPPPASTRAAVRILSGDGNGQQIPIATGSLLGRLPGCDVTLDDPSVSRRHAKLQRSSRGWSIEDLGSTNGVRVNGNSVQRTDIRDGDQIELGSVRLAFAEEAG